MNILKKIKKNRFVTPVRRAIAYTFCLLVYMLVRALPWRVVVFLGKNFGRFIFYCVRYGRKRTVDNLEKTFGKEKSRREIIEIARKVYENFGITAFEFLKMPHLSKGEFFSIVDYLPDMEVIWELMKEKKGLVAASAHMGNWEMLAILGARIGLSMSVLVEPSTNPFINRLMRDMRKENRLIDVTSESSKIMPRLKSNGIICLLFDENAREKGVIIDFLGRPASTYRGPAYFSIRSGAPIACVYFIRTEAGRHRFIVDEVMRPEPTGNLDEDIKAMLIKMNSSLEKMIFKYPEQWNWLYKRWPDK